MLGARPNASGDAPHVAAGHQVAHDLELALRKAAGLRHAGARVARKNRARVPGRLTCEGIDPRGAGSRTGGTSSIGAPPSPGAPSASAAFSPAALRDTRGATMQKAGIMST